MHLPKSTSFPKIICQSPKLPTNTKIPKIPINSSDQVKFQNYLKDLLDRDDARCKRLKDVLDAAASYHDESFKNEGRIIEIIEKQESSRREAVLQYGITFAMLDMLYLRHFSNKMIDLAINLPKVDEKCQTIKCRICEQEVPLEYLSAHNQFCLDAHCTYHKLMENTEKIKPFLNSLDTIDIVLMKRVASIINSKEPISLLTLDMINETMIEVSKLPFVFKTLSVNLSSLLTKRQFLLKCARLNFIFEAATAGEIMDVELLGNLPEAERTIDSFNVINPIAKGGYGRVSLCEKVNTGDLFAIKMIDKEDLDRRNGYNQALAEKDSMMKGMSDHVVQLYYTFQAENYLYLVMEFMPGGDLYSLLSNVGSLDETTLKFYAVEIGSALGLLHSRGIVHCDLKPDNLLISEDGHIKLGDFGLSKIAFENGLKSTQTEKAEGTPEYLAPEVLKYGEVSPAADWWSFGAILFEMAEGVPPFTGDTAEEVFEKVQKGEYEWTLDISETLKDLIHGLLTIDPDERLSFSEVIHHPFFKNVSWENNGSEPAPFSPQRRNATDVSYFQSARHSMVNSLSLNDLSSFEGKTTNAKYYDLWDGMNYYALSELNVQSSKNHKE